MNSDEPLYLRPLKLAPPCGVFRISPDDLLAPNIATTASTGSHQLSQLIREAPRKMIGCDACADFGGVEVCIKESGIRVDGYIGPVGIARETERAVFSAERSEHGFDPVRIDRLSRIAAADPYAVWLHTFRPETSVGEIDHSGSMGSLLHVLWGDADAISWIDGAPAHLCQGEWHFLSAAINRMGLDIGKSGLKLLIFYW